MTRGPRTVQTTHPEKGKRILHRRGSIRIPVVAALALAAGVPAWSPPAYAAAVTNGRIAFVSDRDGNQEIYAMNPDGTGLKNLTNNPSSDFDPAWSPDGTRLAFTSNRDGFNQIYVMAADGSGVTRLSNGGDGSNPTWSPDGTKIAFTTVRDGTATNSEIYVMEVAKPTNLARLTTDVQTDTQPAWSPDGTKIAFVSNRTGSWKMFVMNAADGSSQTQLMMGPGNEGYPSWSPDGTKIAFTTDRDGNREVYVVTSTAPAQNLTNNPADDETPSWSPDGTKIAFTSRRDGTNATANHEIYVMDANGGNQVRLTNATSQEFQPSWQAALIVAPPPAAAGQVTASIPVVAPVVRSVNVSPVSVTYASCTKADGSTAAGVTFPNGTCSTPAVTVTNSGVAANVHVQGADAVPTDNGTHWTLCNSTASCSGPLQGGTSRPGTDQYAEQTASATFASGTDLSASPQCDKAFNAGGCAATAGQASIETVRLVAPQSSSDPSTSFSTTLTWIAVP